MLDLENPFWLIFDSKRCVIRFIAGDSVCLSFRRKTEAEFLVIVIVLVGRPLKAKD